MLAYGTTKAALNKLSLWFASELARHGIAVNAVSPGAVVTNSWRELTQELKNQLLDSGLAKPPTVEALGPSIVWLARQTGDGFTGQVLETDEFGKAWGPKALKGGFAQADAASSRRAVSSGRVIMQSWPASISK